MNNAFPQFNPEERLKTENDFLKMKLMLENGAEFNVCSESMELPLETENLFLKNMVEFEKQFDERKTIKVFDRIGKPERFRDVATIPDNEIRQAWHELSVFLMDFGITVEACSPNVSDRELYRFTTEELFDYEMNDINIPGMIQGFIYDEFHPDPIYDNSKAAKNDCIEFIFSKEPIKWLPYFRSSNLQLNEHTDLDEKQFKEMVNHFKAAHEFIRIKHVRVTGCDIRKKECVVAGNYSLVLQTGKNKKQVNGEWKVLFEQEDELAGYWYINKVEIKGIDF